MPERREPQHERRIAQHRLLEHVQDVLVDRVGLGGRGLCDADARLPLRQRDRERAEIARKPERIGRELPADRLIERLTHALGREPGDARGLLAHQRQRLGLRHEPVAAPARDAAQDPQRVVAERRRVHGAQDARREIVAAAERVDPDAAADVARHRVDREVAPLEIVAHRELRVGLDAEVGVRIARVLRIARADRGLAARGNDLDPLLRPERRAEAHAHEASGDAQLLRRAVGAQRVEQLVDAVPAHEEVDVLHGTAEQDVAQAAADLVDLVERERAHAREHALAQRIDERVSGHRDRLPTAGRPGAAPAAATRP